jgi:hypothetical protein
MEDARRARTNKYKETKEIAARTLTVAIGILVMGCINLAYNMAKDPNVSSAAMVFLLTLVILTCIAGVIWVVYYYGLLWKLL